MENNKQRSRSLSLNTNFIASEPVRSLVENGKGDSIITFIALQTVIRQAGYCTEVDDNLLNSIGRMTGRDRMLTNADIQAIVDAGFFDRDMFAEQKILTTRRLQAAYRRRKDALPIPEKLSLKDRSKKKKAKTVRCTNAPAVRIEAAEPTTALPTVAEPAAAEAAAAVPTAAGTSEPAKTLSRSQRRRARRKARKLRNMENTSTTNSIGI